MPHPSSPSSTVTSTRWILSTSDGSGALSVTNERALSSAALAALASAKVFTTPCA
jgi:hypothetical protein